MSMLERQELLQLDPISNKGTLQLLPIGKKNKQKLVIGDDAGMVHCYEFKRGEPQTVFQTKAFNAPISCLALGGPSTKRDKIFVGEGQKIVGLTKKGKEFFKLTTSLSESIQNMSVEETRFWTGCEYVYTVYDNGREAGSYVSKDVINCMCVGHITRDSDYDALLGCEDNCIRMMQGATMVSEIPTTSSVTALAQTCGLDTKSPSTSSTVAVGQASGTLSLCQLRANGEYSYLWSMEDSRRASISCLRVFDLNKDGINEIVACRSDGRVEVMMQDPSGSTAPSVRFSRSIGESIRGLDCGVVSTVDYNEVVVSAFSGKVISFTTEPLLQRAADDAYGRSVQTVNNENRIKALKKELDQLKLKVEKEKEKKKSKPSSLAMGLAGLGLGSASSAGAAAASSSTATAPTVLRGILNFSLDADQSAYVLNIELQSPIDLIVLMAPVNLEIVESDIGSAVVSLMPIPPAGEANGNKFVATLRCQSQEKRISVVLRPTEGEFGDLTITVVAAMNPKIAKVYKMPIKPLSLHAKYASSGTEALQRPRSKLRMTGSAPFTTIHEWVQELFPEIPPNLDESAVDQKYIFKNCFTGAIAICEYRKNEIVVESESASAIAIAKETITRLATFRRTTLEENMTANEESVLSFLNLVRPRLEHQLSLSRKMDLLDSIQEIAMQEPTTTWLSPEYAEIMKAPDTIRKEFKARAKSLEFLTGVITDLFVDWHRLKGIDSRVTSQRIPELQGIIMAAEFSFDKLAAMFTNSNATKSRGVRK